MARKKSQKTAVVDRTVVNPDIDTKYFLDTLKDLKMSIADYGRHPNVKASTGRISRMFRGLRKFTRDDAKAFSAVTNADLSEVVRRGMGFNDKDEVLGEESIEIAGTVDAKRRVRMVRPQGSPHALLPPGMSGATIALCYDTESSPLAAIDGSIIYMRPLGDVAAEMMGRWCCVKVKGGDTVIRVLKRGSSRRHYSLVDGPESDTKDVEIEAAAVIEWARMG